MEITDKKEMIEQIQNNADIASAKYFNFLYQQNQIGILQKEMTDLFIFEEKIPPEEFLEVLVKEQERIQNWADCKQDQFSEDLHKPIKEIPYKGFMFDPFISSNDICSFFEEEDIFYSGMMSPYGNPTFLLSEISKQEEVGENKIYLLKNELVRDMYHSFDLDAGRKKGVIYIRGDAIQYKLAHILSMDLDNIALNEIKKNVLKWGIQKVAETKAKVLLSHELGHDIVDREKVFPRELLTYVQMRGDFKTKAYSQAVNEVLADTIRQDGLVGTLGHIIDSKDDLGLSFFVLDYSSFGHQKDIQSSFQTAIMGNIKEKYDEFIKTGNWDDIDNYRNEVLCKAVVLRDQLFN